MTTLPNNPAHPPLINPRTSLIDHLRRVDQRGWSLKLASFVLLTLAVLVVNLFLFAVVDALIPITWWLRALVLVLIIATALTGAGWFLMLRLMRLQDGLASAERIDAVQQKKDQPVVCAASLLRGDEADALQTRLRERAEQKAVELAERAKPQTVYPLSNLALPAGTFACSIGIWLVAGAIFPAQFLDSLNRIFVPWGHAPPFSLTQLDPTWSPDEPIAGDDVAVSVEPTGWPTDAVDFVRLDDNDQPAEQYEMILDDKGVFHHTLFGLKGSVRFVLETHGRPTRIYEINTTIPPISETQLSDTEPEQGGTTGYDPELLAEITRNAHPDWPELSERLQQLLQALTQAKQLAKDLDPANAEDIAAFTKQLQDLTDLAEALAGELNAMQGELPSDAAKTLDDLIAAVSEMKISSLAQGPANSAESSSPAEGATADPQATSDWLKQAGTAAEQDSQAISDGLGQSDTPTEAGFTGSNPGGEKPEFKDPNAEGVYDEQGKSGQDGALPPAVMQRVPLRYREHVKAYFNKLAEDDDNTNN